MSFSQIKIQSWPSHDCRPIAVLRREPEDLGQRLGITFRDDQDDLDELKYAGLRLSGGDQILLVRHLNAPKPGTEVYADARSDIAAVLQRFLAETGLQVDEVAWRPPLDQLAADSLKAVAQVIRSAGRGDFSVRAPEGESPIGQIGRELNQLLSTLSTHVVALQEASSSVQFSADQVARDASEIARAATAASEATEEVLRSMAELQGQAEAVLLMIAKQQEVPGRNPALESATRTIPQAVRQSRQVAEQVLAALSRTADLADHLARSASDASVRARRPVQAGKD